MRIKRLAPIAGLVFTLAMVLGSTVPATAALSDCGQSGKFCGWLDSGYGTKIYTLSGNAGVTKYLDSNDRDKTSSVRNRTNNYWCGVNQHIGADETVAEFQPGAQISYVGDFANDKIDHYDIKANSGNCYNPTF